MSAPTASAVTRLAIVGPKHSGKTTLAGYLVAGHGWQRLSHADPLKDGAAAMLSAFLRAYFPNALRDRASERKGDWRGAITRAEIDANKTAFVPLLQWLGTWVREYVSPDADPLIEHLRRRIATAIADDPRVRIVVDDCRFPAEADALREQGFFVLRLVRDEQERLDAAFSEALALVPERGGETRRQQTATERFDAMMAHGAETALAAITPDARVFCADLLELGALAERIAAGSPP